MSQEGSEMAARQASPERWAKAVRRALDEGVEVRQILSSGQWIATSGTMAFNDGGACVAVHHCVQPMNDRPIMPTLPSHQG